MKHEMFIYDWVVGSEEDITRIRIYGLDTDNTNISVLIDDFTPFCYIELPNADDGPELQKRIEDHVVFSQVVLRTHLYNTFNNSLKSSFLLCQCNSKKNIYDIVYKVKYGVFLNGKRTILNVHEVQASQILQLISIRDLPAAGWVEFSGTLVEKDVQTTRCDLEFNVNWRKISKIDKKTQVFPKSIAFDIEVNSEFMNQMPANRIGDEIFQISCVVETDKKRSKYLFTLCAKDDSFTKNTLEGVSVSEFVDEEGLLQGFITFIQNERPNVITGFNILGFDIEYLMERSIRRKTMNELKQVGFNKETLAKEEKIKWTSSAYKNQEFKFLKWEGVLILDLLPLIKRDHKLDTYSLKNVSAFFLKNQIKDPLTYKDIFEAYQTRTKFDLVGKYCVQDSNLCIELMNHFHSWVSLSEMAKVCNVNMFTLYTQGQQIKTYSQVYKYCLKEKIVVNTNGYETKANERYTGAYVIEPIPGLYEQVVPFDFSSLYPSIIIAKNICYSTFVNDKTVHDDDCNVFEWQDHVGCIHDPSIVEADVLTKNIEAIDLDIKRLVEKRDSTKDKTYKKSLQLEINQLRISQRPFREKRSCLKKSKPSQNDDVICEKRYYRFFKDTVKKGVVPTIIQNLLDSRARVKKQMKTSPPEQTLVYDKEQNAYKLSANSMYGAMGVRKGYLPLMPGAMCITYVGRKAIEMASQEIIKNWKGKLIYGDTDSNYVTFPHIKSVKEIWDYAITVADGISKIFPPPMRLEFEQTIYEQFLILSKKRYIFKAVNRDGVPSSKVGKKGVVLARRDNSKFVRDIYEQISLMIFEQKLPEEIINHVIHTINKLYQNCLPYEDYIITKSVGETGEDNVVENSKFGDYKVKHVQGKDRSFFISQCPAHVQLSEKMRNRGSCIATGSRIEYLVIKKENYRTLADRIEDYEYFKKRRDIVRIDPEYYLFSLINPIDQLLGIGIKNNQFIKQQYEIRCNYNKVVEQIKKISRPKIMIKK